MLFDLQNTYQEKGFQILAFSCSQFFYGQSKGTDEKFLSYLQAEFKINFPVFRSCEINGKNTIDVYKYIRANYKDFTSSKGFKKVPWNFSKFLINGNHQVVDFFLPEETSKKIIEAVVRLL